MTGPLTSDQLFIRRLREIVEANLSRETFDVEELAREAKMSRSAIHRRLSNLGKQNASHFIREIRLQKAREMLREGSITASEVAYRVGFGSPAYFSKCFHEYYGYPPGEERKRIVPDESDKPDILPGEPDSQQQAAKAGKSKRQKIIALSAFALAAIFILVVVALGPPRKSNEDSIVVLPFKNLSGDRDNQYFADGIMEDILNNLYHVSNLRVVSRTTAEHFRDTDLTSGEISRQLNARNVLEGSVRRQDDRVRVTVQLIDGRKEQHLWSENYDRELTDILGLQGEIARQVAGKLNAIITESEVKQLRELATANPEAWDNYLRGRFLLHQANDIQRFDISKEGLTASIKYFEMAIAEDTSFAEAYAGLANAWYNLSAWGWYKPYKEGIAMAVKNFNKALELDPDCAEAHTLKGSWLAYPECRFEESKRELQTALDLNPRFATAHQIYAQILMITGPIKEARKHVDRAVELEPYFWVVHNLSAWIYYFEEEYEKGIDACITARDLNPGFVDNNWLFVLHYVRLGEGEKAATALYDLFKRFPSISHMGDEVMDAYRKSGIDGIFTWLIDININRPIPIDGLTGHPFFIAWWYAILGDREQSVVWLERTLLEERIPRHYFNLIATNPDFDILRGDPRFQSVIDRAGLTAYNTRPPR
ncbi:MAG: helix-turn-helix domain-containing protein [Bacteroidales bacterium]|nr:helix-turn-helix domain-containing protein [Bacteroidales bacterium]MDT8373234.1 helix-turn-helix domain-containing protein [Bacteroidales bacterium]